MDKERILESADISNQWGGAKQDSNKLEIPQYLKDIYWWAYIHPNAVKLFERQWLVNLILWGNFRKLRDKVLNSLGAKIDGLNLQVACVYGDFSQKLSKRLEPNASLDIIDVAEIQLENTTKKIGKQKNVALYCQDSSSLEFADNTYDNVILFFLLHEQPAGIRRKTLSEALRVAKPGGKIVIMDYHRPTRLSPFYFIMRFILRKLEPFALDLWHSEIKDFIDKDIQPRQIDKKSYFAGLYQKVVLTK